MQLKKATRQQTKIRLGIQGPSGSGKTMGALQVAYGLTNSWDNIAVIDTEYGSANLYAHLGPYQTLSLGAPFNPEKYIEAINVCIQSGIDVIIIDSITAEWDGKGGILDIHAGMTGNSFTSWGKVTPRHNAFLQAILQCPAHVIVTIRSKQDYVLSDKNGKMVPEKVGLKGIQRDGVDYELTSLFEIDINHNVTASKDRTSLFNGKPEFKLSPEIGLQIKNWCEQGEEVDMEHSMLTQIETCDSVDELLILYKLNPQFQVTLQDHFTTRRKQLQIKETVNQMLNNQKHSNNGTVNV